MSIKNDVKELRRLDMEIKRLGKELNKLRKIKKDCENRILDYCESNDQNGLSFENITIYVDRKKKAVPVKKNDKLNKGEIALQKYGVVNSRQALEEVLNAMKGESEEKASLKIIGNQ